MLNRWSCRAFPVFFAMFTALHGPSASAAPTSAELFAELLRDSWEFTLQESPVFATKTGDHRYDDQLAKVSPAHSNRRHAAQQEFLKRLNAIEPSDLPQGDRLNYALFKRELTDGLAEHRFLIHLTPINNRGGFHVDFPELPSKSALTTIQDYNNYLARLRAFGKYADGHIELMRAGIGRGVTMPAVIMEGWQDSVVTHIVEDPTKSLLYEPFKAFPDSIPAAQHQQLRDAAHKAILTSVVPGYRRFQRFMAKEYLPSCRTDIGASALPDGRAFYRHRVRRFTTLDVSPEEVFATGKAEVKRIRAEMHQIIKQVGFEGDFAAFVQHLRTDPKFYAKTPEELLEKCALILKRVDGKLPTMFGKLPRTPYGLKEVPAFIAPKTTTAYYQPPAGDGSRAGYYNLNTYNLPSRPLYALEALSLHEAVPGHHLQIALQQEMKDQPEFRRYSGFMAYVEGWALYSERLGLEMGFYQDPYSDFGRLSMEMWRACRLVVDPGMHYFGWSRQRAIDYMLENSALSEHNIRAEVDRYIGWPGQALGYKMGELKIRQLRAMAEKELGNRFDLRAFHDTVLASGPVPLEVLEENVTAWVNGSVER